MRCVLPRARRPRDPGCTCERLGGADVALFLSSSGDPVPENEDFTYLVELDNDGLALRGEAR